MHSLQRPVASEHALSKLEWLYSLDKHLASWKYEVHSAEQAFLACNNQV